MNHARRISQIPAADRPREKLQYKGASALSDFELLEVIIGSGSRKFDVSTLARRIQKVLNCGPGSLSFESLTAIPGISTATAGRLLAALEITKRHLLRDAEPLVSLPEMVSRFEDIRARQQEYVICLTLDGGQRLIAQRTVTIGTLDASLAHPRELYADAIADRAASIVIAHNHPSGKANPSAKDITLTQQLSAAGQLLGIALRDHIIVTRKSYFSFRQHHLL